MWPQRAGRVEVHGCVYRAATLTGWTTLTNSSSYLWVNISMTSLLGTIVRPVPGGGGGLQGLRKGLDPLSVQPGLFVGLPFRQKGMEMVLGGASSEGSGLSVGACRDAEEVRIRKFVRPRLSRLTGWDTD